MSNVSTRRSSQALFPCSLAALLGDLLWVPAAHAADLTGHWRAENNVKYELVQTGAAVVMNAVGSATCLVTRGLGVDTPLLSAQAGVTHFRLETTEEHDADATAASLRDWRPDWIVVDHYRLDARWHGVLKATLPVRIAAIDDLADRPLAVDLLVDHNHARDHRAKYAGRLPPGTRLLAGPRHALLSPKYAAATGYRFRESVKSIGIFMGGVDAAGISEKAAGGQRSL